MLFYAVMPHYDIDGAFLRKFVLSGNSFWWNYFDSCNCYVLLAVGLLMIIILLDVRMGGILWIHIGSASYAIYGGKCLVGMF